MMVFSQKTSSWPNGVHAFTSRLFYSMLFSILIFILISTISTTSTNIENGVIEIQPENWDTQFKEGKWLVKFYAPWCIHCKQLEPLWEELAVVLKNDISVARVNCQSHPEIALAFGIDGFPTLYLIEGNTIYLFEGPRTLESLVDFARGDYLLVSKPKVLPKIAFYHLIFAQFEVLAFQIFNMWHEQFKFLVITFISSIVMGIVMTILIIRLTMGFKPSFIVRPVIYIKQKVDLSSSNSKDQGQNKGEEKGDIEHHVKQPQNQ